MLSRSIVAKLLHGPSARLRTETDPEMKEFAADPEAETERIKNLTKEAIEAGFYNIDIDTSTLVDLDKPTLAEQQEVNVTLAADFAEFIRKIAPAPVRPGKV